MAFLCLYILPLKKQKIVLLKNPFTFLESSYNEVQSPFTYSFNKHVPKTYRLLSTVPDTEQREQYARVDLGDEDKAVTFT